MSDVVIRAENLGKKYRIQHQQERQRYVSLRDVLANRAKSIFRNPQSALRNSQSAEDFWALRDVNFDIKQGEVVGIIGRNGAGKSTLLKILSRITEPTNGRVGIKGRVASLLEVGTGFHPELTGRENIYLNGAVLGMTHAEVKRKFDEIVSFAEVERFIDTPVKRFSTGMYMRLAFAVAAHLEPDILIVDEVLAVGDAQFQEKCLGKMDKVAESGRTVLFVSHNLATIEALCKKAILLNSGHITQSGQPSECIQTYLITGKDDSNCALNDRQDREGAGHVRMESVDIVAPEGLATGKAFSVRIQFKPITQENIAIQEFGISIWSEKNVRVISLSTHFNGNLSSIPSGGEVECLIPSLPLVEGRYVLNAFVASQYGIEDYVLRITEFVVTGGDFFGTGKLVDPEWGLIAVAHRWRLLR